MSESSRNFYGACVASAITFAVLYPFACLSVDFDHDGIMLKSALDVWSGQALHRDTFTQYGPLTTWLHAAALSLHPSLLSLRLFTVVAYGLSAFFLFLSWAQISNRIIAASGILLFLVMAPVFAVRSDRAETGLNRWAANAYYAMMRRFALKGYPRGGFDYILVDRQVAEEVVRIGEKNTNLMSLVFWLGFSAKLIPYVRRERQVGQSRWTLGKKVKLVIDSFVAFSYFPVRAMSLLGVLVSLTAFGYAAFIVAYGLLYGVPVAGFSTLASLLAMLSGL